METVNIKINGVAVAAPKGSTILEAARLANIEKAEKVGARKNYYANQTRHIRQVLKRAERRERNTLL